MGSVVLQAISSIRENWPVSVSLSLSPFRRSNLLLLLPLQTTLSFLPLLPPLPRRAEEEGIISLALPEDRPSQARGL